MKGFKVPQKKKIMGTKAPMKGDFKGIPLSKKIPSVRPSGLKNRVPYKSGK